MSPVNSRPKTALKQKKSVATKKSSPNLKLEMVRLRTLHSQNIHRFARAIEKKGQIEIVIASRRGHVVVYPLSITATDDSAGRRGDSFRFKARLLSDGVVIVNGYVEGDGGWIEVPHVSPDRTNPRF
jgi:hypothetical protein